MTSRFKVTSGDCGCGLHCASRPGFAGLSGVLSTNFVLYSNDLPSTPSISSF